MALKVGILGFGGLGQAAAKLLSAKQEMQLVVAADKEGFAYAPKGLDANQLIATYQNKGSLGYLESSGILT
ncbi:MAG: saccharopine dehydrogenase-like oxidoreductase, partial [Pseudanabaena sp.]